MNEYTVDIGGVPHTVLLDEAEAERLGAKPVRIKQAPEPVNKAAQAPKNKASGS